MDLPEIVMCFAMTGPKDYTLRVATTSLEDCERFFKEKLLLRLPGVAHVNASFAFSTVKPTTALLL